MLEGVLLFCLILFVILVVVAYFFGYIRLFSSIAISAIVTLIVLMLAYPPMLLISEKPSFAAALYPTLALTLFVIVLLFVVYAACRDKRDVISTESKCM